MLVIPTNGRNLKRASNAIRFLAALGMTVLLWNVASGQTEVRTDAKKMVDTLTSPTMSGRGYNGGDKLAAQYILNQFASYGLDTMRQPFPININTFPGNVDVTIDKKKLTTGKSFIVAAQSKSLKGKYKLRYIDFSKLDTIKLDAKRLGGKRNRVLWYDKEKMPVTIRKSWRDMLEATNGFSAAGFVEVTTGNLTMTMSQELAPYTMIVAKDSAWNRKAKKITVDIEQQFKQPYTTQNVIGMVRGSLYPDSFVVVSAHYDHLGKLGRDVYFPGANDNASGTAMMMQLAKSISQQPLKYTAVFIGFSGEEAGLVGSKYFTENPKVPLKNIKFLLNLDMNGTGQEGIKVVNGAVDTLNFNKLKTLNQQNGMLLASVQPRGKAANSDHYFFTEAGVPTFFIYTLGGVSFYHDVYDRPETLEMPEFNDLHKLFLLFLRSF